MMETFKNTWKDLYGFFKKPQDRQDKDQSFARKSKRLFSLLIIEVPLMLGISLLINGFKKYGWISTENHQVSQLLENTPVWLVFLLTVLLIPFIEELIFRFFLRFRRNFPIQLFILIFPKSKNRVSASWHKRFGIIFYISCIAFALIHITNYDLKTTLIYLFPILILPQLILGMIIGYLRVRYDFITGYLMHVMHNAIFISVALFSMQTSESKIDLSTETYLLKIQEGKKTKTSEMSNYNQDSIYIQDLEMKYIISSLTKKDISLITSSDKSFLSRKFNLQFKNTSPETLNRDAIILQNLSEAYSYSMKYNEKITEINLLKVQDTLQLFKHKSKKEMENSASTTSISFKTIELENTTLKDIASSLSDNFDERYEFEDGFLGRFNFKLPARNVNELEQILKSEYGISLEKVKREIEYLHLDFEK